MFKPDPGSFSELVESGAQNVNGDFLGTQAFLTIQLIKVDHMKMPLISLRDSRSHRRDNQSLQKLRVPNLRRRLEEMSQFQLQITTEFCLRRGCKV